jgi:hypothetical protein
MVNLSAQINSLNPELKTIAGGSTIDVHFPLGSQFTLKLEDMNKVRISTTDWPAKGAVNSGLAANSLFKNGLHIFTKCRQAIHLYSRLSI